MHVIRYAVPAFVGASPPFDPRKKKLPMIRTILKSIDRKRRNGGACSRFYQIYISSDSVTNILLN
jgi:hypothetical protein